MHRVLEQDVEVGYRVVAADGSIGATFSSVGDPFCEPLGTCGTSGTLGLTLQPPGGQLIHFYGSRFVRRSGPRAAALQALRAGRFDVFDDADRLDLRAALAGSLRFADGLVCRDTVIVRGFPLDSSTTRSADRFELNRAFEGVPGQADTLRSRCPGPSSSDVAGGGRLAGGAVPIRDLGASRIALALSGSGHLTAAGPYEGSRGGVITLSLARAKVSLRTRWVRVPVGTRVGR